MLKPKDCFDMGLNVVPLESYETKKPLIAWQDFIDNRQSESQFNSINWNNIKLFAVVCGTPTSKGYLGVIDFDDVEKLNFTKDILPNTYIEKSPHGFHLFYWSKTPVETISKYSLFGYELLGHGHLCSVYSAFNNEQVAIVDNLNDVFQKFMQLEALNAVRKVFHKWFEYEDETFLDLALAVRVHTEWLENEVLYPLWLAVLGASGSRKTETLNSFDDEKVKRVENLTENTFVSGNPKISKNDLAPKLKGKLMLTLDFAPLLNKDSRVLKDILSILRRAYDGEFIRQTGYGLDKTYSGIFFNWILCSTSAYDKSEVVRSEIGQRELCYRLELEKPVNKKLMKKKIRINSGLLKQMRSELKEAVKLFVEIWKSRMLHFNDITVSEEVDSELSLLADFIRLLRANVACDAYTGDPLDLVEPEEPTRVYCQLLGFYKSLKSLSPNYRDETAILRLKEIAKSSINRIRFRILKLVCINKSVKVNFLRKNLGLEYKAVNSELGTLYQLGFVQYQEDQYNEEKRREWFISKDIDDNKREILRFIFPDINFEKPVLELQIGQPETVDSKLDNYKGN